MLYLSHINCDTISPFIIFLERLYARLADYTLYSVEDHADYTLYSVEDHADYTLYPVEDHADYTLYSVEDHRTILSNIYILNT